MICRSLFFIYQVSSSELYARACVRMYLEVDGRDVSHCRSNTPTAMSGRHLNYMEVPDPSQIRTGCVPNTNAVCCLCNMPADSLLCCCHHDLLKSVRLYSPSVKSALV